MFERFVTSKVKRRRRWAGAVVASSVFTHVVVIVCFVVAAMWHIEKLAVGQTPVVWVSHAGPPPGSMGAPPPPAAPVKKKAIKKSRKIRPRVLTQPTAVATLDEPEDSGAGSDAIGVPGGVPGSNGNDPLGLGTGDGGGGVPIGEQIAVEDLCDSCPECCEKPKEPPIVPAKMIEGDLIQGDKQISPPEPVKVQMAKQGVDQLVASIRMCLDDRGHVSSLDSIKSSGFAAYDARLTHEMNHWRYRPYRVNGQPVAVCTVITFIYRMH